MSENLISVFGGGEKGKDDMDGKRSPSVTGWGKGEKKKSKKKGKKAELYDPELRLDDMPGYFFIFLFLLIYFIFFIYYYYHYFFLV